MGCKDILTMQNTLTIVRGDLQQEGMLQGLLPSAVPAPQGLSPLAPGANLLQAAFEQEPVCWHTAAQCYLHSNCILLHLSQ